MRYCTIIVSLVLLLWTSSLAQAFTTDYPVTCTTTTASLVASVVQAAIVAAADGAVVCVPAGSATWGNFAVGFPANKSIVLAGAAAWGGGTTTISGGVPGQTNTSAPWSGSRITGFTFNITGSSYFLFSGVQGFRIDHNIITRSSWLQTFLIIGSLAGGQSLSPSEGVIDHNTMTNTRIVVYGEWTGGGGTNGHRRWSEALNLGTVHQVYVEANTITQTTGWNNFIDDNLGGRYVARFNTITDSYTEAHSIQGDGVRAQRLAEIHDNTFTQSVLTSTRIGLFRGGIQFVFHNTYNGNWVGSPPSYALDNVRSCNDSLAAAYPVWGIANGTSVIDGAGASGYRVRDQIGAGTDSFFMTGQGLAGGPYPTQPLVPSLFWKNNAPTDGGEVAVGQNTCVDTQSPFATHYDRLDNINQNDRDYYKYAASFTGTSGIGEGTHAARPATCTTGVYYWETDTGEWNATNGATADGRLFQCAETNTWALYYTPYTYPHPLAAPTTPPAPAAISGLSISGSTGGTLVTLIWPPSTNSDFASFRVYVGTSSGVYGTPITLTAAGQAAAHAPLTRYIFTNVKAATYCFVVKEVNTLDLESAASNEVCTALTGLTRAAR